MPRHLRLLLALIAAAIGAVVGAMGAGGAAAGISWIFLFGDDPWPAWAEPAIIGIAALVALVFAVGTGRGVWLALDKAAQSGNTPP